MINKDLKTIADYFKQDQALKLIEECGELIQAMIKMTLKPNQETAKHLIEEMADVDIVLQQTIYILENEEYFNKIRNDKIQRTLERIERGYYE